jgi:CRISPR/Cas system CSM-associated protein Csm2 small subunit
MIQKTSIETYYAIKNSGLISDKRLKVFDIFWEHPDGLTGTQVSEIFKNKYPSSKHSETIRNRITELRNMGVIDEIGVVECDFTNRKVMKFAISNRLPVPLEKKLTLNERVDSVLESIALLGKTLNEVDKIQLRKIYKEVENLKKK